MADMPVSDTPSLRTECSVSATLPVSSSFSSRRRACARAMRSSSSASRRARRNALDSSALRSAYSWRLLELLTRFESTGWAQYTIEDFCVSMDASEKQRSDFAKIRTKIIEPAVRELREKDGWLIDWQPIKKGRKVAGVRFDFKRDPQTRLELT